ncbi:bZIP transcription factor 27 isoform X1 [Helianthus annuus]|uniref:bZIP transcription factor 27 isoform X1 n=1 Tax=Helianthus annuus TaxID=4232 RepID=UPI001652C4C0|nr:bZIP transcription factor 27 isoform X1 [Helianthus annuus]
MLSHHGDASNNLTTDHQNLTRVSSSSSSTTSCNRSTTTRTMEEVWKDINLSTTNHHATAGKGYRGFILQDFLAKPFSSNDTTTSVSLSPPGYGSPSPPPPPPPQQQQQPMLFNLNSGPDQLNFLTDDQVLASANSSSGLLGNNIGGMRILPATDRTGGDRRHKRMIKNRESAARSRARKQAYTNELENEVERLKEENAMLKRQQQQVATASQMTKKRGLQRTSTAPF